MVFFQKLFDESQTCCVFELALEEEPIVTKKNSQDFTGKKDNSCPHVSFQLRCRPSWGAASKGAVTTATPRWEAQDPQVLSDPRVCGASPGCLGATVCRAIVVCLGGRAFLAWKVMSNDMQGCLRLQAHILWPLSGNPPTSPSPRTKKWLLSL